MNKEKTKEEAREILERALARVAYKFKVTYGLPIEYFMNAVKDFNGNQIIALILKHDPKPPNK